MPDQSWKTAGNALKYVLFVPIRWDDDLPDLELRMCRPGIQVFDVGVQAKPSSTTNLPQPFYLRGIFGLKGDPNAAEDCIAIASSWIQCTAETQSYYPLSFPRQRPAFAFGVEPGPVSHDFGWWLVLQSRSEQLGGWISPGRIKLQRRGSVPLLAWQVLLRMSWPALIAASASTLVRLIVILVIAYLVYASKALDVFT